jgi:hypothetical protein
MFGRSENGDLQSETECYSRKKMRFEMEANDMKWKELQDLYESEMNADRFGRKSASLANEKSEVAEGKVECRRLFSERESETTDDPPNMDQIRAMAFSSNPRLKSVKNSWWTNEGIVPDANEFSDILNNLRILSGQVIPAPIIY